jgi:Protein of unknown function (DUF4232)
MSPTYASTPANVARRAGLAATAILLLAVPGCAGHTTAGSSPASDTAGADTGLPGSTAVPTAAAPSPPTTASVSAPPSRGATTTSSSPLPAVAFCRTDRLQITATRLPGAAGTSYAQITLVNTAPGTCQVTGYPALTLLDDGGAPLAGNPTHLGTPAAAVVLRPRQAASTLVQDALDDCRATTRSATARIAPPGQTTSVLLPLVLASCPLAVKPFTAGTNPAP